MQPALPQSRNAPALFLLLPGAIVIALFFGALTVTTITSLTDAQGLLSLRQYERFLSDQFYLNYLGRSFRIAAYCTPVTLLLGYPFAYVMAKSSPSVRLALTLVLVVQFFTSYIVRTYALVLVLGNNGIINRALMTIGIVDRPVSLLFNEVGVAIGLIVIPLPFMIFPIYSVLKNIEPNLEAAATSLGATRFKTFLYVTLPLSLPGVIAGVVLVFLFDLTAYIMPGMLGGGYFNMIANLIQEQAMAVLDKRFASAIALVLLLITLLTLFVIHAVAARHKGADA
jgi:putative spermidine/putrescine transport system permease protein